MGLVKYKVNTSQLYFLYTDKWKPKIFKKYNTIYNCSEENYLGISMPKHVQDLSNANCKMLMKEIET